MYEIPRINIPHLKTVSLSVDEVKAMPDAELLAVLSGESNHEGIVTPALQQLINYELQRRTIERKSKPHWSVIPSFCLLIVSALTPFVLSWRSFRAATHHEATQAPSAGHVDSSATQQKSASPHEDAASPDEATQRLSASPPKPISHSKK